jgi:hypothetical protein
LPFSLSFSENFVPPFPEKEVTNGNTSRGSARQRFLTNQRSLPKHFRAATAGSLNSQHSLSQLSPSDLRKTARESRQSRERFSFKSHFLSPFVLTSFVCFEGSSLFVCSCPFVVCSLPLRAAVESSGYLTRPSEYLTIPGQWQAPIREITSSC